MVYSAAVWAFDWAPPYENAIASIAKTGCKGVELRIRTREELAQYYTDERVSALKAQLAQTGLALTALNVTPQGASSVDKSEREQAVRDFRRAADIAEALGAKLITVAASYPFDVEIIDEHYKPSMQIWEVKLPDNPDFAQNYEDYLDTLHQFAAVCREKGMKLAIENQPTSWARNTDAVLRLLEKLGEDNVGVTYDVANLTMVGELAEIFAYRVNKHIFNVQLADNHGLSNVHWRPGKGKNDFNALMRALADVGYDGPYCLELGDAKGAARNPAAWYEPFGDHDTLVHEHELAIAEMERVCREEGV